MKAIIDPPADWIKIRQPINETLIRVYGLTLEAVTSGDYFTDSAARRVSFRSNCGDFFADPALLEALSAEPQQPPNCNSCPPVLYRKP